MVFTPLNKRIRMIVACILAYVCSSLLQQTLFYPESPQIKPEAKIAIKQLPQNLWQMAVEFTSDQTVKGAGNPFRIDAWILGPTKEPTPIIPHVPSPIPNPTSPPQNIPYPTTEPTPFMYPTQIPTRIPTVLPPTSAPTSTPLPTPIPQPTTKPPPTSTPKPQPTTPPTISSMADFGKCLADKGFKIYTQPGCGACTSQKKDLGEAMKYITEISCPSHQQECAELGVRATPSWGRNGVLVFPGAVPLSALSDESGCPLPK